MIYLQCVMSCIRIMGFERARARESRLIFFMRIFHLQHSISFQLWSQVTLHSASEAQSCQNSKKAFLYFSPAWGIVQTKRLKYEHSGKVKNNFFFMELEAMPKRLQSTAVRMKYAWLQAPSPQETSARNNHTCG